MPGGHRVHILGGRHDGLMARPALARNGSGSTPRAGRCPAGMHAAQFSKTAVRLRAAGLAAATPKTAEKRPLAGEAAPVPATGSVWALGSRTLLSRSASSATAQYSAARRGTQCPRHAWPGTVFALSALLPRPISARSAAACGGAFRPERPRRQDSQVPGRAHRRRRRARRSAPLPARSAFSPRCE
jgi:hypothetical protein